MPLLTNAMRKSSSEISFALLIFSWSFPKLDRMFSGAAMLQFANVLHQEVTALQLDAQRLNLFA